MKSAIEYATNRTGYIGFESEEERACWLGRFSDERPVDAVPDDVDIPVWAGECIAYTVRGGVIQNPTARQFAGDPLTT